MQVLYRLDENMGKQLIQNTNLSLTKKDATYY